MSILDTILGNTVGKITGLISEFITDKDKALQLQTEIEKELIDLQEKMIEYEKNLMSNQSNIIQAEINSESWLTRNWRPIVMLTFTGLIVSDWLGYSAPNLTPELKMQLFTIIQYGLSGYIVGRSGEKIVKEVGKIISNKRRS